MSGHPMQPPPELLIKHRGFATTWEEDMHAAYAAGADAELEACCDAIYLREEQPLCGGTAEWLRAARRPNPPMRYLKQYALELMHTDGTSSLRLDPGQCETIRRALEAIPDD